MVASLVVATLGMVSVPALDAVLDDPKLKGAVVAAMVVDADGNSVYERNPSLRVVPASNQKLLSSAFALHTFGPDYRPETKFWRVGTQLLIESPGDPSVTFAQLKLAKSAVGQAKSVILKQAYRPGVGPSWEYDDLMHRYAARVAAFSFDQGAFALWAVEGKPVLLPDSFGVRVDWKAKTGPVRVAYDPFKKVVEVTGAMPAARTRLDTLALPDPALNAAQIFAPIVSYGTFPTPTTAPTYVLQGEPMGVQIANCLQPSDNLRAENLMLMAAARRAPLGATPYAVAQREMSRFLTETVGVEDGLMKPQDGSGLSRHNIVSAKGIIQLLRWADQQPTRQLWREALAGPNRPGTLRARLQGIEFAGKTGSLNMVSSLSGYLETGTGKNYTVSLVLNNFNCSLAESRAIMDQFVKTLTSLP